MKNHQKDTPKDLLQYKGQDQIISSFDLMEMLKHTKDSDIIHSKLPLLDYHLDGGFEAGELIALSGPPKTGKTLLMQSLTFNFLEQKKKTLWFQYEVTPKRFLKTFGDDVPLFYLPQKLEAYDLEWIRKRIMEALVKQGISVVVVDHLHFLFDIASQRNTSLQIGNVVRFLKQMAIEYNLIVFLLCHMKKVSFEKEPSDEDIRDSSLIGSESDTVLIVWREPNTENEAILKIRYARRSGVRDKKIKIAKLNGVLRQIEEQRNE